MISVISSAPVVSTLMSTSYAGRCSVTDWVAAPVAGAPAATRTTARSTPARRAAPRRLPLAIGFPQPGDKIPVGGLQALQVGAEVGHRLLEGGETVGARGGG